MTEAFDTDVRYNALNEGTVVVDETIASAFALKSATKKSKFSMPAKKVKAKTQNTYKYSGIDATGAKKSGKMKATSHSDLQFK